MELLQRLDILKYNVDVFFLITMASFVFLMQCGFAFPTIAPSPGFVIESYIQKQNTELYI